MVLEATWRKDGEVIDGGGDDDSDLVITKTGSLRLTNISAASR